MHHLLYRYPLLIDYSPRLTINNDIQYSGVPGRYGVLSLDKLINTINIYVV